MHESRLQQARGKGGKGVGGDEQSKAAARPEGSRVGKEIKAGRRGRDHACLMMCVRVHVPMCEDDGIQMFVCVCVCWSMRMLMSAVCVSM